MTRHNIDSILERNYLKCRGNDLGMCFAKGNSFLSIIPILFIKDALGQQNALGHTHVSIINKMYFGKVDLGFLASPG